MNEDAIKIEGITNFQFVDRDMLVFKKWGGGVRTESEDPVGTTKLRAGLHVLRVRRSIVDIHKRLMWSIPKEVPAWRALTVGFN